MWGGVCGAGCVGWVGVGVCVCVCVGVYWCVWGGVCGWGCLWVCGFLGVGVGCVCVHFISVLSPLGVTCNAANFKISVFPLPERHASIEMHGIKCNRETNK